MTHFSHLGKVTSVQDLLNLLHTVFDRHLLLREHLPAADMLLMLNCYPVNQRRCLYSRIISMINFVDFSSFTKVFLFVTRSLR